jgi:hypothetical protein
MNIFSNDTYFTDQLQRAKRLRNYGMLAILLSFVMSLLAGSNLLFIYVAYPLLIVGLPLWTYGRSIQRRVTQSPRPDKEIDAQLKGLNNKFALHHYTTVEGALVKHLLISPSALIVIESSEALGPVTCSSKGGLDVWKSRSGWLDRISGVRPQIGNPSSELTAAIQAAHGLLSQVGKPQVPVIGLVVFTRSPELDADDCSYAALPLQELKETVKGIQHELGGVGSDLSRLLTTDERRRLSALLAPSAPPPPAAKQPAPARKRETGRV